VLTEFSAQLAEGALAGDGDVTSKPEGALTLRLRATAVPLAALLRALGVGRAPAGTAAGDLELRTTAAGSVLNARLTLADVTFGEFLGALGQALPEGSALAFATGRVRCLAAEGTLTLASCVLVGDGAVLSLGGTIGADGGVNLKALWVTRGELVEDVLYASDPATWPLTAEQRAAARAFMIGARLDRPAVTAVTLAELFGQREPGT
jgi:hypothetical protein